MPHFRLLLISGALGLAVAGCDSPQKTAAVDLRQCPKTDAQACATITPATPATTTPAGAKPAAGADAAKTGAVTTAAATSKSTTVVKSASGAARGPVVHLERRATYTGVASNAHRERRGQRSRAAGVRYGPYQRYQGEELLGGQDDRVTIERRYAGRADLDHTQVYGGPAYGGRAFDRRDDQGAVERGYSRREEFNGYSRPPEERGRDDRYRSNSDAARALAQRDEQHGSSMQRRYSEQQFGDRGYGDLPPPPPPPPLPPPPRPPLPPRPPVIYQDGRSSSLGGHVQSGSSYSYEEQSRESHRSSSEQYSSGGGRMVIKRRGPPLPPPPLVRVPDGSYGPSSDSGYRLAGQDDRGFLNWTGKVEY